MRMARVLNTLPLLALVTLLPRAAMAQNTWNNWDENWSRGCDEDANRPGRFCEDRVARIAAPRLLTVNGGETGAVSVRAWDGNDVEVRQRIQAWAGSSDEARQLAQQVRVRTEGGSISATGPAASGHRGYTVSYLVLVPRRMDLRVETHNGPLAVNGVTGRMELTALNGPLDLHSVGGDVRARVESGPLSVTLSGQHWNGAGLDAQASNGPVALSVPRGFAATLTTGTNNGTMIVDLPGIRENGVARQFTTRLGGGGAPVRVVSINGPVVVRGG
ncbi:MAG TPA: hypothetical protein VFJ16_04165 [Longimicrobium sp.]|nr:hypothetical protein [Longimicrobium sp.]